MTVGNANLINTLISVIAHQARLEKKVDYPDAPEHRAGNLWVALPEGDKIKSTNREGLVTRCEKIILNEINGSLAAQSMAASAGRRQSGAEARRSNQSRGRKEGRKLTTATLGLRERQGEPAVAAARKLAGVVRPRRRRAVGHN